MQKILINNITGSTPINVFLSDQFGNNKTYIGVITDLNQNYEFDIPSLFSGIDKLLIWMEDSSSCERCNIFDFVGCGNFVIIN
jgi:hypothetical protein